MKKTMKFLALLLAALMLLAGLAACGGGKDEPNDSTPASENSVSEDGTAQAPADYLDITGVDLSAPAIKITETEYDAMSDLATKMQNMAIDQNTVVEITGFVGASMMTHTIVIPNGDGQSVGTTFEIVGDAEVPTEGTKIHLTGVVRMSEYYNVLVVPAEQFEVIAE